MSPVKLQQPLSVRESETPFNELEVLPPFCGSVGLKTAGGGLSPSARLPLRQKKVYKSLVLSHGLG
ncbi:hypothetical protein Q31a_46490 [Aureliella helgolandensis]|uniref:Uncharacterized protein n=1 Tax=Aureliella helgolandensis TaxID=2527968 RepID=A0A518GCK1_9BACT|nr:hypothetical protein Q31a_46490 [Aureliella helgolandensis]